MKHLETVEPARAHDAAWLRAVEQERHALRHLLVASQGALVLWDQQLCVVWNSPQAAAHIAAAALRAELERAAASTLSRLATSAAAPSGCAALGCAKLAGAQLLAQFSSVRTHTGLWLLAELKGYPGHCPRFASLSAAERRVLCLLMAGLSNREIGRQLFISLETVKTHVSRILQKLEVSSRAKAASLGREAGFAGPSHCEGG